MAHWAAVMLPPESAKPALGHGGHGVEVGAGGDAEFEEALNGAEVEEGGAEAAAGEAESDAASCVGRNGSGGMLAGAAPAEAERGASPWGSESLASGHEHLDDAGELVLRAGGVGDGEVPRDAQDVEGGREAWPRATAHSIADARSEGPVRWTRPRSGLVQQPWAMESGNARARLWATEVPPGCPTTARGRGN